VAILNGLYIHVTEESAEREVDATSHPVEQGVPTTDTVKAKALSISLSGKIVDYGNMKAAQVLSKIKAWQEAGSLVLYKGRNTASSMQIKSFQTSHPNTNHGGADFSMTLTQVRIAKSAYTPKKASDKEKEEAAKKNVEIKVGSIVLFKGGSVYVASDAKKAAATRGRSTCKVTKIGTASWSVHKYHLISTDGGMVYGWVDRSNIDGCVSTGTSGTTNAGTQQIKSNKTSATTGNATGKMYPVYHKVKSGDTVYKLVVQYSYLGKSVGWVISNSPNAFSKPGNATTLKVGAYLLMGYKQ
jgi:LysM repeat protein